MRYKYCYLILIIVGSFVTRGCSDTKSRVRVTVFPDSVLSNVSNHPVGINVDYFMDDDKFLKPARSTVEALKSMGIKYLRYPGGNKSDQYLFSLPPYEKSQPALARTGKEATGYERVIKDYRDYKHDVLDFDEFISMCREVGAEPVIVVAADEYLVKYPQGNSVTNREGLIRNAVEWVRYSNIRKKYNVRYWMIGNECWHENNVNSTPEIYARDVVDFSHAMKAIDPSIFIIPNGNSVDFFKTLLSIAGNDIDYLCLSNYPVWNYTAGYVSYKDTLKDLLGPVRRALTALRESGEDKRLKLIVSEYGPFDWAYKWPFINDMGHTLCNFEMAGEQLNCPEIEFSCFWNTRWIDNDSLDHVVYDALDKNGSFNATGYGMMIWGKYLGEEMVSTTSTLHIRSFASFDRKDNLLCVFFLNKADSLQHVELAIGGYSVENVLSFGQLSGRGPHDVNPLWRENIPLTRNDLDNIALPGVSVSVIKLRLKDPD